MDFRPSSALVSAVIELDGTPGAGPRMLANVTDCEPRQGARRRPVRVWFDRASDTYAIPRFALEQRAAT